MKRADVNVESDEEYEINLLHYKQQNSWDCGLSCVMMTLPKKKRDCFDKHFNEICKEEGFGMSTWTIDLCYLLKRFSVKFVFYTTVFGVNPDHKSQFFYEKILPKDTERVIQRFKDAEKSGINIKLHSVKTEELIHHIKQNGPVILLTNADYLDCDICKRNNSTSKLIHCLPRAVNYYGHYVVLCGFNLKKSQFYYRNPAYSSRTCAMEISALNKARKCYGTDEDYGYLYKSGRSPSDGIQKMRFHTKILFPQFLQFLRQLKPTVSCSNRGFVFTTKYINSVGIAD